MTNIDQNITAVEFTTENNVRMLEQLNRTLELLRLDRSPAALSSDSAFRLHVEKCVLEAIAILCTPLAELKEVKPDDK